MFTFHADSHHVAAGDRDQDRSLMFASGRRISSQTLFVLLHWGGWIAFGIVPFVWTVSSWGLVGALLDNGLFVASGGSITLLLRGAYRRARARRLSYLILALGVPIGCGLVAIAWYWGELWVSRWCFRLLIPMMVTDPHFAYGARLLEKSPLLISAEQWYVYTFTLLTWSSLYFGINSVMDLELERGRVVAAMNLAETARLRVLQSQLNPHFLFNALNGVTTLIRENKGADAARMVSTLSDFLRSILRRVDVPEITVSEELVFLDHYIELQRLRFTDRLRVDIDVQEDTYSAMIPTLILQPLVENAVQHGVLMRDCGGSVFVSIRRQGLRLRAAVEDDGPGPTRSAPTPFGVGLANTAERLQTLYGKDSSMTIGRAERGGFSVVLSLPFREETRARARPRTTTVSA
jgi:two-component system, LytTR family, sensor kinase